MAVSVDQLSLPSKDRVEPGSCDIPLGHFPTTSPVLPDDPNVFADDLIERLNACLIDKDSRALSVLFMENSYWRDHLCLSWDLRTLKGPESIAKYVTGSPVWIKVEIDRSSALAAPHVGPVDAYGDAHGIEFFIKVSSNLGTGQGVVRLVEQDHDWKFFTVFTSLVELTGHEESVNGRRPAGVQHGEQQGRRNWQDRRVAGSNFEHGQPAVLIVGECVSYCSTARD